MTEDREKDGAQGAPGAPDPIPSEPAEPAQPAETDELIELIEDTGEPGGNEEPGDNEELVPLEPAEAEASVSAAPAPGAAIPAAPAQPASDLQKKVEEKDAQIAQVMNAYRTLKKDTEKLRARAVKAEKRRFELSKNDFIGRFVEVLDNLDRAIDSIENNFDSDAVLEGIILLRSRLVQLLREEGLEKIFVGGQPFDPTHSEAAAIEPVEDDSQDNIVLKELQRGYMLKGALLRPARVVVGRFSHTDANSSSSAESARHPSEASEASEAPKAPSSEPAPPDDGSDQ
ncbi:MAG: nucleotide exchange factor GrpE [Vicinamibacteria bacterium]